MNELKLNFVNGCIASAVVAALAVVPIIVAQAVSIPDAYRDTVTAVGSVAAKLIG